MHRDNAVHRKVVVVGVNVAVAATHLFTGPRYRGPGRAFVTGYLIDLLLPFAAYFLLVEAESTVPWLRPGAVKVAVVAGVMSSAEAAQYFGFPIFGRTFDPLDLAAYACGAVAAAVADRWLIWRVPRKADCNTL